MGMNYPCQPFVATCTRYKPDLRPLWDLPELQQDEQVVKPSPSFKSVNDIAGETQFGSAPTCSFCWWLPMPYLCQSFPNYG